MSGDHVLARVETPCSELGFRPPPTDCHLRAMDVRGTWVIYVWSPAGRREDLLAWLREHGDFEERGPQSVDRVLAVETAQLRDAWRRLFEPFEVQSVVLTEQGSSMVGLRGPRQRVRDLVDSLGDEARLHQVVEATESSDLVEEDPLTETERDAILSAFDAGYFDVPRRIRLEELAEQLGKSAGALSTLLRRGTQRLVADYIRQMLAEQPDAAGSPGGDAVPEARELAEDAARDTA